MSAIRKVGMLGLGKMGAPMARHLLAKGYNVAGYDPVDDARKQARSLGVSVLDSPRDVALASDVVIVVVGFDNQVETVVFGSGGIMEAARPGLIVVIGSTLAPRSAQPIAEPVAERGRMLLDMPLARGEAAATAGKPPLLRARGHAPLPAPP